MEKHQEEKNVDVSVDEAPYDPRVKKFLLAVVFVLVSFLRVHPFLYTYGAQ